MADNQAKFKERLDRIEAAIALKATDRVPVMAFFAGWLQRSEGSNYKDIFYDYDKAGEATLRFYEKHPLCDAHSFSGFTSGRANELAKTQVIDWPGRPGSSVPFTSSHQVIEHELMTQEEYPEMLKDFHGFLLKKYIPRAFPALSGLSGLNFNMASVLNTRFLAPMTGSGILDTYKVLTEIAEEDNKAAAKTVEYRNKLAELGFPGQFSGASEAPYDILGDYFRGTMGIFEDLIDDDMHDYIIEACDMFADQQIKALSFMKDADMPVKRIFFPLHKGMDGFMNDVQFSEFYWKPLKKVMLALIDMGVTPYIYTEGPYQTRLEYLADVPKGKVLYHFEKVNMKDAKRILGGTACICGNLSVTPLEFGTKEAVVTELRQLLDDCMDGGGYIFDFNGSLENAKPENVEAMFETLERYGKY